MTALRDAIALHAQPSIFPPASGRYSIGERLNGVAPAPGAWSIAIEDLREQYESLDNPVDAAPESAIDPGRLLTFEYEHQGRHGQVVITTDEFTAVCPWNGLPDFGTLTVTYVPDRSCVELKSLKYYLMSYRPVGIVQEHAANRILNDLVEACLPVRMEVALDYKPRGGLHTTVSVSYAQS